LTDPKSTLALCKWLKERVAEWEAIAKADLAMRPGERLAADVNGLHLGFVTMVKGSKSAKVINQTALLAYVKSHHPTEVETLEQIRPAFVKKLLDDAAKKGALVDADGVVIDGLIDIVYGAPYPKSTLADDADITVAALLAKGALGVNGLKELEAPKPEPVDRFTQDQEAGAL
jgi:hypothetical protein